MTHSLTIYAQEAAAREVALPAEGAVTIGRDDHCDIVLSDQSVSRRHAQLTITDEAVVLEDLGSKNGCFVDHQRIQRSKQLHSGQRLRLGDVRVRLVGASSRLVRTAGQSHHLQRRLTPELGPQALIQQSLKGILDLSDFSRGFVLLRAEKDSWKIVATTGIEQQELNAQHFSGSLTCVRQCVATKKPIIVHRVDPVAWLAGQPSVVEGGIQALLCLPMEVQQQVIGVIYADRTQPGEEVHELELSILASLAQHAAMALAIAKMETQLKSLAGEVEDIGHWAIDSNVPKGDTLKL